jgi:hypothetical protein
MKEAAEGKLPVEVRFYSWNIFCSVTSFGHVKLQSQERISEG